MTGQVKEEVLTRFGELGLCLEDGKASFLPVILQDSEIRSDGTLSFTWCGTPVTYRFGKGVVKAASAEKASISVNGSKRAGNELTVEETKAIFAREGLIKNIDVQF